MQPFLYVLPDKMFDKMRSMQFSIALFFLTFDFVIFYNNQMKKVFHNSKPVVIYFSMSQVQPCIILYLGQPDFFSRRPFSIPNEKPFKHFQNCCHLFGWLLLTKQTQTRKPSETPKFFNSTIINLDLTKLKILNLTKLKILNLTY